MNARTLAGVALAGLLSVAQAPDPVVAQSGQVSLTASQVRQMIDALDPEARRGLKQDPALLTRLVRAQMLQALLLQEARARKWDQMPSVALKADQARDGVITGTFLAAQAALPADYPTDADVQAAYEANKARLIVPRQFHLAQVFVAAPPGAAKAAEDEAARKLRDVRAALARPKTDFAAVARKSSDDAGSAANGGDLGWVPEEQMLPAIKAAVSGLPEGSVSEPVRTADGWHILRLVATRPAAPAPLADVRDQLVRALRQQRQAQAERAYADELLRTHPVQLDEIQLGRIAPQ